MRSRRGLGVLAVCGLVFGLMAISATGAQAASWMINGSNVTSSLTVDRTYQPEHGGWTVLAKSGENGVTIVLSLIHI